jgi:hypothetical protein
MREKKSPPGKPLVGIQGGSKYPGRSPLRLLTPKTAMPLALELCIRLAKPRSWTQRSKDNPEIKGQRPGSDIGKLKIERHPLIEISLAATTYLP